ncbi:MAG: tetratricopeptide repeat protein [Bdellovibrionales bacterium]|nr:tetratricopeptide repeat protein [Bdellovibrionales bacterium]
MQTKWIFLISKFGSTFLVLLCIFTGCTSQEGRIFQEAMTQMNEGSFKQAIVEFEKVVKRTPDSTLGVKAAKEGARLSLYEMKDFGKALEFLKLVILYSKDPADRVQSQKQLAGIYFDNLQNYRMAIREYTKLLQLIFSPAEQAQYRIILARSYFYLGEFNQSEAEIKEVLKANIDPGLAFSAIVLQGNIKVEQKAFAAAAEIYKKLIADHPERALQENIHLSLAVCYEESRDFANAIKILESLRGKYSVPEYVELRIKRVQERQRNLPGARGYRK